MTWAVIVDPPAKRALQRIPARELTRVLDALEAMKADPFAGDIRKLKGELDGFRRRVGAWRLFFDVDRTAKTIYVTGIERRTTTTY